MLDLYHASRDDLVAALLAQRELLAEQAAQLAQAQALLSEARAANAQLAERVGELARRVKELEDRQGPSKPQGLAGNKLEPARPAQPERPRKNRAVNRARLRTAPTAREVHAAAQCPACGRALGGGSVAWTREVLELAPPAPVQVTEHVYLKRHCAHCRKTWTPTADLAGVVVGRSRLGVGLVSAIATLREVGRWPLETIRWYLATFHDLRLSVGALVKALKRVADAGAATVAGIRRQIGRSAVVHADETGWREDGHNGYVWSFSTPEAQYFARAGRNKEVVNEVLGDRFDGVLVSDFYAGYDHYPWVQQRCWAHLLRDADDLARRHPTDPALAAWAAGLHDLYAQATAFARGTAAPPDRRQAKRRYEALLLAHCPVAPAPDQPPQRVLCQRVRDYLPALFEFVLDPAIPATNNAAERALRHLVTCRKISGGTRSAEGTETKMALATLFGTWRAEGRNPFLACRQLLAEPALP
jgi:transposase